MKIRDGFVSNSSSSSFVILLKKESDKCELCGRSDPNFINLLENSGSSQNSVLAIGEEDVLNELGCWYTSDELQTLDKEICGYVDQIKSGEWDVAYIKISNHAQDLLKLLNSSVENGSIVIIRKEEG